MIIIVSQNIEKSTDKIIEWLGLYNFEVIRINQEMSFHGFSLCYLPLLTINLFDANRKIKFSDIRAFLYRRGEFSMKIPFSLDIDNAKFIQYVLGREWAIIKDFLHKIEKPIIIGSFEKEINNNKIFDILLAQLVGLNTPASLVTSLKDELISFIGCYEQVISKPLKNSFNYKTETIQYNFRGTHLLKKYNVDILSDSFFPAFFQEYIEKEFEIRSFYLKGKFYSMAIFSQNDVQTKIDYRNYNREKPNRNLPFQLPDEIEEKLEAFMQKSGLDTGSIDIIKAIDGRYVFLEVNPVGQFDWLSGNCNYYLEEKIAYYLTHGEHIPTNYG